MPIRRVLVPLDGTPFSETALPTAAALTRRAGGALVVLHVRPTAPPPSSELAALAEPARGDERDEAYVREVVTRERGAGDAALDVRGLVMDGALTDAIRTVCAREAIDLVVLAAHPHGALAELLAAGAARAIAHDVTDVPVLVLRGDDSARPAAPSLAHVLVAIDDDTPATAVVAAATELASLTGAALTLVTVRPPERGAVARLLPSFLPTHPDGGPADDSPDAARAAARDDAAFLEEIAERLRAHGARVATRVVEDRDAAEGLGRHAVAIGADVIAVGARANAADALRRALSVPVLLAPPRSAATRSAPASA